MRMADGAEQMFALNFVDSRAEVARMGSNARYAGHYRYMLNESNNSALLDVNAFVSADQWCKMEQVQIRFQDTERSSGNITEGTSTEFCPDMEEGLRGKPISMRSWTVVMDRNF